jgi:hypothetical protein
MAHRPHGIALVFRRRQHNDASGEGIEIGLLKHSQAIFVGHTQIEKEDVRFELGQHVDTLVAIRCLAHNRNIVLAFKELTHALAENYMVIGHHDPDCMFCFSHISGKLDSLPKRTDVKKAQLIMTLSALCF